MPKPLEAVSEGTSGAETSRCMGQLDVIREWRTTNTLAEPLSFWSLKYVHGHGGIPLDRY